MEQLEYYLLKNNQRSGPFNIGELAGNGLSPDMMVWRAGLKDWTRASELQELSGLLSELPPQVPLETPPPPMPNTWLVESILVTVFCCLPFGLVGIFKAAKVSELYASKQYEEALEYSESARKWTLCGLFILPVLAVFGLLVSFFIYICQ